MRDQYNNKNGRQRQMIIKAACIELLQYQQTIEYIVQTGYSAWVGYLGSFLAYVDNEIEQLKENMYGYPFLKAIDYGCNVVQGYITRVLCDQINLWVSLLECTQQFTDEFLMDYKSLISSFVNFC